MIPTASRIWRRVIRPAPKPVRGHSSYTRDVQPFELNGWTIEPDRLLIVRGAQSVRLEPKAMALLCALAERPGVVLSKEELLAMVWSDVIVEDDVITTAMYQLRRALGDDHRAPRYVETIPRRGYRLIASVRTAHTLRGPRRARLIASAAALIAFTAAAASFVKQRSEQAAAQELHRLASHNLQRGVGLHESVRLLRRAAELDPPDPLVRGSLALALALSDDAPPGAARHEAELALRHDPANRDARIAEALVALWEEWNWEKARLGLESVAGEGDPVARAWLAYVHALAGDRRAAVTELEGIAGPPLAAAAAATTHLLLGDPDRAEALVIAALRSDPKNDMLARQRAKIRERRMEIAGNDIGTQPAGRVGLTTLARVHLTHGETDLALAALERAFREREHEVLYLRVDRRWDAVRADPRFQRIVAAIGP